MDPINYSGMLTQLDLSPLQRGFALRDQRAAQTEAIAERQQVRQLAQAKFTAEQEQDQAYRDALTGFSADPTPAALLDISARFPEHSKALQEGFKTYTSAQQRDIIGTAVNVLGAATAGNTDLAARTLTERRDALKRAGVDTTHTDAALGLIKSDDPAKRKQGIAYMATVLSGAVGPDDAAKIMENFGAGAKAEREERRLDQADQALELRERSTEASIARGEAASARAERAADRADRKAAGGGSSGGGKYEYRVVNGALQRRKVG